MVLLGLDFGATKLAAALAAPDGTVLHRREAPTGAEQGAAQAIERGIALGSHLLQDSSEPLSGVGVASMGITLEDRVLLAPNVPGWEELTIPTMLRAAFHPAPVRIENDVKAATYAELRWGALRGVENGVYVNLGSGLAAGLVIAGRIVRGAHGAAGEIGLNPRSPGDASGAGRGRAPLEEWLGGKALEARLRGTFDLSVAEAFARYPREPAVAAELDAFFDELAFHLAALVIALDPARLVLGAGLMRSGQTVLPALQARLAALTPFPVDVVPSRFGSNAALRGAVALAIEPIPWI